MYKSIVCVECRSVQVSVDIMYEHCDIMTFLHPAVKKLLVN